MTNDGGADMSKDIPAFPTLDAEPGYRCSNEGMTLRDYFAAQALAGIVGVYNCVDEPLGDSIKKTAELSYKLADALLQARGKE